MSESKKRVGVSLREFARRDACSEGLVRRAIAEGRLSALADGSIDPALAGTKWRKSTMGAHADAAASVDEALRQFEQQATAVTERVLQGASYSDALRIKENYLALLRQLEYSIKAGAVIDLTAAEHTVFDLFRAERDAWLNWPARVAPLIAADLDFEDVERLGAVLATHVQTQLAGLGEPQYTFGRGEA
jgi:hypothetical protein